MAATLGHLVNGGIENGDKRSKTLGVK